MEHHDYAFAVSDGMGGAKAGDPDLDLGGVSVGVELQELSDYAMQGAVTDHYLPSVNRAAGFAGIENPGIRNVVEWLDQNTREFGIEHIGPDDPRQGITHVIAPELGLTQPGMPGSPQFHVVLNWKEELQARVPVLPVAMIGTFEVQPPGQVRPNIRRVGIRIGKPLDFTRYAGLEDDRFVLRSMTDEIMYELMMLSGQEYVDTYAAKAKEEQAAVRRGQGPERDPDRSVTDRAAA